MRVFRTSNSGNFKDALLEKFCHMNVKLHFAMVIFWENLFFLLPWKLHLKMRKIVQLLSIFAILSTFTVINTPKTGEVLFKGVYMFFPRAIFSMFQPLSKAGVLRYLNFLS